MRIIHFVYYEIYLNDEPIKYQILFQPIFETWWSTLLFDFGSAFNNLNCWKKDDGVFELIINLINSSLNNMIMIGKSIPKDIQTLQNAHDKIEFL